MKNEVRTGHLAAGVTILIWGITFISTKVLLKEFGPVEILFLRFAIGFAALMLVSPHRLKVRSKAEEITFILAGLCGICLYYLLENVALTYTLASNVGVIISTAPFFTAILSHFFEKNQEKLTVRFFIGFLTAMTGICLISFHGSSMEMNPMGDFLAVLAAFVWACYSILTRRISGFGYNTIQSTRRIFGYGILFMLPKVLLLDFNNLEKIGEPVYLFNILFLGLGASALCFVTWNFAVKVLGAVKTSVYIYMVPVITVITSAIVLRERITVMAGFGTVLTLAGLMISESKFGGKEGK